MATNWWRVATNPNYLTDDELHAIMDADRLVLSLAPVSPQAIPETVTFCQVIGVMREVWKSPHVRRYVLRWIDGTDTGDDVDWTAVGRDHARNLAILRWASTSARTRYSAKLSEDAPDPRRSESCQLSQKMKERLEDDASTFLRAHRYFFQLAGTDIYVVQVYEKHAWGIRFYVRARVNTVQRALITVPALAHLSLDLANIVPSIKRSRSMLEVDEY
ncbi:hypothetical protein FOMPIDRAFT_129388 [Fomitopsis schrenkii]|uniref:Uncharacterized protein n=1 Tax=Fomitopsis schrenkii TaxID=2126942 RepID=S8E2G3_FOMSC|nr:hypothetical protein FOMPIDRAFT_129388 [Fomitopsis schrenkii]